MQVAAEPSGPANERGAVGKIKAILAALEIPETDPVATAWLDLVGRDNEYALHSRAHRHHLSNPRSLDDEFRQFWNNIQTVLNRILEQFWATSNVFLAGHKLRLEVSFVVNSAGRFVST